MIIMTRKIPQKAALGLVKRSKKLVILILFKLKWIGIGIFKPAQTIDFTHHCDDDKKPTFPVEGFAKTKNGDFLFFIPSPVLNY